MKLQDLVPVLILFTASGAGASELMLEISAPAASRPAALLPYRPDNAEPVAADGREHVYATRRFRPPSSGPGAGGEGGAFAGKLPAFE